MAQPRAGRPATNSESVHDVMAANAATRYKRLEYSGIASNKLAAARVILRRLTEVFYAALGYFVTWLPVGSLARCMQQIFLRGIQLGKIFGCCSCEYIY